MPQVAAEFGLFFDEMHNETLFSQLERSGRTCQAAADDKGVVVDFQRTWVERLIELHLRDCHAHQVLGFRRSLFDFVHVNPGALVSNVRHLKKIWIQSSFSYRTPE